MSETLDAIMTNPKVVTGVLTLTSAQTLLDYSAPVIELLTKVASLILVFMMIYFHYQKIKKIKDQRKIQDAVNEGIAIREKEEAQQRNNI